MEEFPELDFTDGEEDSDVVSEYFLNSEEEEDPFTPAAAKNLLYSLAEATNRGCKAAGERGNFPRGCRGGFQTSLRRQEKIYCHIRRTV